VSEDIAAFWIVVNACQNTDQFDRPFNRKEHSIIVVMSSVAFSVASATDVIVTQTIFYKQDFGIVFQFLLIITTQSLGYGIAGVMRKFLGKSVRIFLVSQH